MGLHSTSPLSLVHTVEEVKGHVQTQVLRKDGEPESQGILHCSMIAGWILISYPWECMDNMLALHTLNSKTAKSAGCDILAVGEHILAKASLAGVSNMKLVE